MQIYTHRRRHFTTEEDNTLKTKIAIRGQTNNVLGTHTHTSLPLSAPLHAARCLAYHLFFLSRAPMDIWAHTLPCGGTHTYTHFAFQTNVTMGFLTIAINDLFCGSLTVVVHTYFYLLLFI